MEYKSHSTLTDSWINHLTTMGHLLQKWAPLLRNEAEANPLSHAEKALKAAAALSKSENPWFTEDNLGAAFDGLAHMLRIEGIEAWAARYRHLPKRYTGCRVGIIAAGNIPMVAFHDILCTLVAGHVAVVKLSNQDKRLLPALFAAFGEAMPGVGFEVEWVDGRLPQVDAVVATGSNNSSRYFEYYFSKYPHIIRRNRNSVSVLTGTETDEQLQALGADIFSFFGLGCRNVSKLYLHDSFDLNRFFEAIYPYHPIVNHHKYANNYDYFKALWLMNLEPILDNGFLILRPSEAIASPPGVMYYERYSSEELLQKKLASVQEELQCVVSLSAVPFGKSQQPELWDYADGVDTMEFLLGLPVG